MKNLKKLRVNRKLSQQKLAEEFRLSQQSIYKYENGLAQPDIQTLKNFASFFHTTIDYLVGYTMIKDAGEKNMIQAMTPEEIHFLNLFRELSPATRTHITALLEQLNKEH